MSRKILVTIDVSSQTRRAAIAPARATNASLTLRDVVPAINAAVCGGVGFDLRASEPLAHGSA